MRYLYEEYLKYKPRLLIAGYHLPNDCIDLINLVTSFRDDYKIYIRQYNYNKHETVIYFV